MHLLIDYRVSHEASHQPIMNCQKCRTPLKLDSSLQDLHPSAAELLTGKLLRIK